MNIGLLSNLVRENSINNNKTLGNSLEKLSTGLKINKASDNASGLAISDKLRTQASGIKQGIENANSAIAMLQIADKSMDEISNILDNVKGKLIQAHTNTTSDEGRTTIKKDIEKLLTQIENISGQTNYNTTKLLSHNGLDFQVGDKNSDIISLKDINVSLDGLSGITTIEDVDVEENYINKSFFYISSVPVAQPNIFYQFLDLEYAISSNPEESQIVENRTEFSSASGGLLKLKVNINPTDFLLGNSENPHYSSFNIGNYFPTDEVTKNYFDSYTSYLNNKYGAGTSEHLISPTLGDYYSITNLDFLNEENIITTPADDILIESETLNFDFFLSTKENGLIPLVMENTEVASVKFEKLDPDYDVNNLIIGDSYNYDDILASNVIFTGLVKTPVEPETPVETEACGTLKDLKNMSSSDFTFECAGEFQTEVDNALTRLNDYRSEVGSTQNQLESSVRNSMTGYVNIKNAESIIRDVDYAEESANFNKANIISQASSFAQVQANEIDKQTVAQLLK